MKTIMSSKGQIVLPVELREQDDLQPGQKFFVERIESGQYLIKREPAGDNTGMVDWLLSCPVHNWFKPIPSESTSDL